MVLQEQLVLCSAGQQPSGQLTSGSSGDAGSSGSSGTDESDGLFFGSSGSQAYCSAAPLAVQVPGSAGSRWQCGFAGSAGSGSAGGEVVQVRQGPRAVLQAAVRVQQVLQAAGSAGQQV